MDKIERIRNGETVIASDADMDVLEAAFPDLRSIPNPKQCGLLDRYLAFITKYPSTGNN